MRQKLHLQLKDHPVWEAMLISTSLVIFSLFIHDLQHIRIISYAALFFVAWVISNQKPLLKKLFRQISQDFFKRKLVVFNLLGLEAGLLAAFYYHHNYSHPIWPGTIKWFTLIALCIAFTEEILFRGIVQSLVEKKYFWLAPFLTALAHAAYKATIFIPLINEYGVDVNSLFFWSFVPFIGLGYLKQFSKSIVPCIIAHGIFDIIVYADAFQAPWWVW